MDTVGASPFLPIKTLLCGSMMVNIPPNERKVIIQIHGARNGSNQILGTGTVSNFSYFPLLVDAIGITRIQPR